MDIITTARHFEMTPAVREHAEKRLEKLQRYLGDEREVHVTLSTEKYRQIAEISLHVRGTEIISRDVSDDMLSSIDRVVDRIERQIKRLAARRRERKARRPARESAGAPAAAAAVDEEEEERFEGLEEEDFAPVVVRGDQYHAQPVSVEEAITLLRDRDEDFLLFTNAQTGKVALVHLRPDGNYGLVEPS